MQTITRPINSRMHFIPYVVLITLVSGILLHGGIWRYPSDWSDHLQFITDFTTTGDLAAVHVAFHAVVLLLGQLIGLNAAALLVGVVSINLTWFVIYRVLRQIPRVRPGSAGLLALALLTAGPITLLTVKEGNLYFGYIGFQAIHSPTMVVLKPLALLLYGFVVTAMTRDVEITPRRALFVIVLCLVSTFTKPNFALSLLPALALVVLWRLLVARMHLSRSFLTWVLLVGVVLTGTLVLQYIAQFLWIDDGDSGIAVAPLEAVLQYESSPIWIAIKFLMSISFPAIVTVLYRRYWRDAVALQLAWLVFAFGALQMYLLAETGSRTGAGNFWWGAQIGLLILFLASLEHLFRHWKKAETWRYRLALALFILHVTCGAVFHLLRLFVPAQFAYW